MTKHLNHMDPEDALYASAREFGIPKLAKARGLSPESLYQKFDKSNHRNHIKFGEELDSYLDQFRAAEVPNWDLALVALCFRHGGIFVRLPAVAGDGDLRDTCTHKLLGALKEFSEFTAEVAKSVEANGINATELQRIQREGADVITVVHQLMAWAEKVHEDGRHGRLRVVG